jgi:hypothetical protein
VQAAAAVAASPSVSQTVDRSVSFNETASDCDEDSEGIEGKDEEGDDSDGGNNSDWENPSVHNAAHHNHNSSQKELLPGPRGVFAKGSDDTRCVPI